MEKCLFCRIVAGEIPADVVYSDDDVLAFRDIEPQAPVHVLVIPRRHVSGFGDTDDAGLLGAVCLAAARVAEQERIAGSGYRSVVNNGRDANQTVGHLHMHVLGGRAMSWPPG